MQHAHKSRFSAKISALLVAVLALGSLPLAPKSQAAPLTLIQFLTTSATITEGNTILLTVVADPTGVEPIYNGSNFSYHITGPIINTDNDTDLVFNNTPGVAAGGIVVEQDTNQIQIPVTIVDDGITEGPETILVTLTDAQGSHGTGLNTSNTTFSITINDNTGLPFINFTSSTSTGLENQPGLLTVELSRTSTQDVVFQWTTGYAETTAQDHAITLGGNTFPADFTNAPIVLADNGIILAGQLTATINLGVQDDILYEESEDIKVGIAGIPTNAQFGNSTYHTYTIYDNDTPSIQFVSTGSAGSETVASHDFVVTFSRPSTEDTEITISTNGISTARDGDLSIDGNDWNLPNSMRIIPAGQTSWPIRINIKDDTDTEGDETAVATIQFAPHGFNLGPILNYTYTIIDDESVPPTPSSSGGASSGGYGTAIPQSTASAGGVSVGSAPTPVVTTPSPTTPAVSNPAPETSGEVLGVQTSLLHELIAKLKFGSTSNEVTQLQVELQKLGFFPAKAKTTRFYGLVTKAAVQKYLDTKANEISLQELAAMLKLGQRGAAVKKLQTELKAAGFFPANTTATGFYGNQTKQAVAKYLAR